MSTKLRIALLGPLMVTRGEQTLHERDWRSRPERRLLGMLLVARGARVPAEQLIEWLWPDAPPDTAAITLRSAISSLRRTLDGDRGARASTRYILTRQGGYAWNLESGAWLDLDDFLALTAEEQGARSEERGARLERALALYRGDLLADEPEAPWAMPLRRALRERFLVACAGLADLRCAAGAYAAAIELAERGLASDRLREPLYRALMRAQAGAGDVAGALRSFERYRRLLGEELGAEPAPETQALHTAILRGEFAAAGRGRAAGGWGLGGKQRAARAEGRDPSMPFVGRAAELADLGEIIAELARGRGRAVALIGEAGIGKTRLADQALAMAEAAGALTIRLRCTPLERELPFAPLGEALHPLLRGAPDSLLSCLPQAALAQVAELLPALRERLPSLPSLPDALPGERRNRLLNGLVGIALALAQEGPLAICCDDGQWADEATLAAIGRLARHAPRRPLLIVLAYRSDEVTENPALHTLLRTLGREELLRPFLLQRFDDAEVAAFVSALAQAPRERVADLAPRLAASSGGNPLFLSVAVQSLLEAHGAPSLAALLPRLPGGAALPDLAGVPRIRELLLARLDRLPGAARDLAEWLAVIGRPVSLDLAEQFGGPAALEAAQILLERQLLVESADNRLAFSHDLVRSIVAGAIVSPRRRLLHRQAADAIATLYGDRPERAAELAFHYRQAGQPADGALLRYATRAGDHARAAFGYGAALGHYETALGAAERLGSRAAAGDVVRAFAGRLRTYEALLDWDGIHDTAERYERWAVRQPAAPALIPPRRLVLLRALMGDLAEAAALSAAHSQRRPDLAPALQDMLQRTATILRPVGLGSGGGGWEMGDGGWVLGVGGQASHPPTPNPQPLPGSPAADLPALLGPDDAALALFQVGWAVLMQGLLHEAEPCLMRAYELAGTTGQAAVAVVSALQLAHLHDLGGDRAATQRWLERSLDLANRAPEAAWASIWPRIHQGFLWLLDDRYDDAQACFAEMAAQLQSLPAFHSHRASVEAGLGMLALARGEYVQAEQRLMGALRSPQLLYGFVSIAVQHGLARLAAQRGDLRDARSRLRDALAYSAERSLLPEYVRTAIEVARIERDYGDPAQALALLHTAAGLAEEAGFGPLAAAARSLLERLGGSNSLLFDR
jgi:DNA-binding SARP family transcriptional activator